MSKTEQTDPHEQTDQTDQVDQVEEPKKERRKVIRRLSMGEINHALMKWLSIYEPEVAGQAKSSDYGVQLSFEDDGSIFWDIHVPSDS